ncbi:sensor domain-containing diguanylate cyclase [Psychrobacillus sp. OK032]|uniref:sensor domain-containing diguanylate cyclase n=1 Tax=Psychrobacillus sp. OK032 TaxID=1884358 RepID=UPI0008AC2A41|nr:sensor domain-containing diguanylate cyclase [Psychrobacillus sp. OK032]SES09037.1 diguanylate cyclase (GGDEF) domain-containing protein [Psychrobacillus sp. OK032]
MNKTLKFWILTLTTFTMIAILSSSLFSSYLVTKKSLIENSLEQNEMYALKLGKMSEEVFKAMEANLEARKPDVIAHIDNPKELTRILDQLLISGKNFNSLSVIGSDSIAIATSPNVGISGNKIESPGVVEALRKKESFISKPYKAITGRLLILVSTPLFDESDTYLGMLNGTIYLQEDNFIQNILAEHFSEDGSYVFVVDEQGTLIYHPDKKRIGENVSENNAIQKIMNKKNGAQEIYNTQGTHLLAGYSYIPESKWGVVSQTPFESSLQPLNGIMTKMFIYSLPFVILFFVLAYLLSEKLASPLKKLAISTMNSYVEDVSVDKIKISTWYFEAKQLTETIDNYRKLQEEEVANFKNQSMTDPLTGLKNRRYSELLFADLLEQNSSFSIISIDIDHFKRVNDEYGHQIGDETLQFLASKMMSIVSDNDVCVRLGGEEFVMILPNYSLDEAFNLAEKFRNEIEMSVLPMNRKMTISAGVGEYKANKESVSELLNRVDEALYVAKSEGRNKTIISP